MNARTLRAVPSITPRVVREQAQDAFLEACKKQPARVMDGLLSHPDLLSGMYYARAEEYVRALYEGGQQDKLLVLLKYKAVPRNIKRAIALVHLELGV